MATSFNPLFLDVDGEVKRTPSGYVIPLAKGGTSVDNTSVAVNNVFAGPASGSSGPAGYRSLSASDLGSGSASSSTYLRGDQTWAVPNAAITSNARKQISYVNALGVAVPDPVPTTGILSVSSSITANSTSWQMAFPIVHPNGQWLYIPQSGTGSTVGQIQQFAIGQNGALTLVATFADGFPTVLKGTKGPLQGAIDPTGEYLVTLSKASSYVEAYGINQSTGALTPLNNINTVSTSELSSGDVSFPALVLGVVNGNIVAYLLGSVSLNCVIACYSLGPSGLTYVGGSTPQSSSATSLSDYVSICIDSGGTMIWVGVTDGSTIYNILSYSIGSSSIIPTYTGSISTSSANCSPFAIAVDPLARFLFSFGNNIETFTIGAAGALTAGTVLSSGVSVTMSSNAWMIVDPLSQYVYICSDAGLIQAFTLNPATGALAPISNSLSFGYLWSMAIDPVNRWLWVLEQNTNIISTLNIRPAGSVSSPSGTGIVTVTSGVLNTSGQLTGAVTTSAGGLATTLQSAPAYYAPSTTGTNTYACTCSPGPSALVAGQTYSVLISITSTNTTCTMAINGLAATTVTRKGTSALAVGDLVSGTVAEMVYDGTYLQLQNPQSTYLQLSGGTLTGALVPYSPGNQSGGLAIGSNAGNSSMTGSYNLLLGQQTGSSLSSGNLCTYIGYQAGIDCTSGAGCVMVGGQAGYTGATGQAATTTGTHNTFIGQGCGGNASGITNSTALGWTSLATANNQVSLGNTSVTSILCGGGTATVSANGLTLGGSSTGTNSLPQIWLDSAGNININVASGNGINHSANGVVTFSLPSTTANIVIGGGGAGNVSTSTSTTGTAIGYASAKANTTGKNWVAIGYSAGGAITTGNYWTSVGYQSGGTNITGSYWTSVGCNAGQANTGGSWTAVGCNAGYTSTTGGSWTAVGCNAGYSNSLGSYWTAIGYQAGHASTVNNWTAIGYQAGYTNTTGTAWVAIGYNAGYASTGDYWTAIGLSAGQANTTGINWVAIGYDSGSANTTGSSWTAIGAYSGYSSSTGSYWTAIGSNAGQANTYGTDWTAIGYSTGNSNTTGSSWTAMGSRAGYGSAGALAATLDSNWTAIGSISGRNASVTPLTTECDNWTAIGYGAQVTGSNQIQLGNSSVVLCATAGTMQANIFQTMSTAITANGSSAPVPNVLGIGATGGPQTAAQFGWVKILLSDGSSAWVQVYK